MSASPAPQPDAEVPDGLLRLIGTSFKRYSRDPSTRRISAQHLLSSAVALYAAHTSAGEAALLASEILAELGAAERKRGAR